MADLLSSGILDAGAIDKASDFLERSPDALGISGELYGRCVGQEFPLAGNSALDESAEEHSYIADYEERETKDDDGTTAVFFAPAASPGAAHDGVPN